MVACGLSRILAAGLICWAAASAAHAAGGAQAAAGPPELRDYDVAELGVGGPIALTDQHGQPFTLAQLQGHVALMFFGYTYCPDVCPLSMSKLTQVRRSLGETGSKIRTVFITIDPERDTRARMKAFVENFPGDVIGLTGSKAQIDQVARRYRTRFSKGEASGNADYLLAHTAYLYVLDGHGKVRYMFPPDVDDALLATAARWLIAH
jgi:protein SCO1/2